MKALAYMPTVLTLNGRRVVMYFNDHPPPHCHVIGAGGRGKFMLNCPSGPVSLDWQRGFSRSDVGEIKRGLNSNVSLLCGQWGKP